MQNSRQHDPAVQSAGSTSAVGDGHAGSASPGFALEAATVMRRLRAALSGLVDSAPVRMRKSRDLQKLLGIDSKLSWQIFKLAGPGDPLSLAPHVPGASSMRRLLKAAREHGIAPQRVDDVRAAYESFEQLVETHAGDRTSFHSMARGTGEDDDTDLRHRKARFAADRHYAGAEVETLLCSFLLHPGAEPDKYDYLPLRCRLGQRRLRHNADVVVDRFFITDFESRSAGYQYEPLDREALEKYGALLLPEFCSQPPPKLRTTTESNGFTYARLDGDTVGRQSSADTVFGQIHRNAPILDIVDGKKRWHTNLQITIPATVLIVDKLIHRPSYPNWNCHLAVHWQGPREFFDPTTGFRELHPLPFRERITRLEGGVAGAYLRESPRYLELLRHVTNQMGWKLDEFDVYRVRIEYPLLYTALLLTFELPTAT